MGLEIPSRRGVITGLIALAVTAPAIVRAGSLMPIKVMKPEIIRPTWQVASIGDRCYFFDGVQIWSVKDGEWTDISHEWFA